MTEIIKLTLPLPPSANRYWRNFRGRAVVSKEAKEYKEIVGWLCQSVEHPRLDGPVSIQMDVYRARKSGDLDNFTKCLLDSLNGYVYQDDSQVVEIHARRFDDKANPRVEVRIRES